MKFNFKKFERESKPKTAAGLKGLKVHKNMVTINHISFKPYDRVDIYTDLKNGAIKILSGSTYKLSDINSSKVSNTNSKSKIKSYGFSSAALIKNGLKKGYYKCIGNNTFILQKDIKLERKGNLDKNEKEVVVDKKIVINKEPVIVLKKEATGIKKDIINEKEREASRLSLREFLKRSMRKA